MAKTRNIFVCQNCGAKVSKWMGKCNECQSWNSFVEEVEIKDPKRRSSGTTNYKPKPKQLGEITINRLKRIDTQIQEFNRTLGGGVVPGSVIIIGGEPGIGKSTLALQLVLQHQQIKSLYVSGEESLEQIKMRAERIGNHNDQALFLSDIYIENVLDAVDESKPDLVIIDSIQTMVSETIESSAGTISQVRESCARLQKMAKESNIPVILIGHINKEGSLAGPKVLEHMVDTVLQFEGDNQHYYRILRTLKNRFGSTSEIGIFEMGEKGLHEVKNPSEILLTSGEEALSGIAVAASMNGIRPFLIEIQSLASTAVYGNPQRTSTGFDIRRLNMLLAVLEKRAGFRLASKDVFLNIAGGIKVSDPAIDLAVIAAVLSSSVDIPIAKKICFCAEVSLSGEIKPVSRIDYRISEAENRGFSKIFISKYNRKSLHGKSFKIEIEYLGKTEDVVKKLFKQSI